MEEKNEKEVNKLDESTVTEAENVAENEKISENEGFEEQEKNIESKIGDKIIEFKDEKI